MDGCGERDAGVLGKGTANRSRNKSGVVAPLSGACGHVRRGVGENRSSETLGLVDDTVGWCQGPKWAVRRLEAGGSASVA